MIFGGEQEIRAFRLRDQGFGMCICTVSEIKTHTNMMM